MAAAPLSVMAADIPAAVWRISIRLRTDMIRTLPYGVVQADNDRHANTKVGKDEWIMAALHVIAADGVGAVKIESLAQRLGITKGSFYWHFADRQDLLESALDLWYRRATGDVIARLDAISDPQQRLRALFVESFGDVENGPIDAQLVGQADDPLLGPTVVHVTAERLAFLTRAYRDLGLPAGPAAARARLAYAAYLGLCCLRSIPGGAPESSRERAAFNRQLDLLLSS
jgi:AcrR family transcriptional regulator